MGTFSQGEATYELERSSRASDAPIDAPPDAASESPWWEDSGALASMLNGFGAGYWSRDIASGRLECSKGCKGLFGVDPDVELPSWADLRSRVHPEDREAFDERIARAVERGQQYRIDHRVVASNGQVRWLANRCGLHKKPSGELLLAGVTFDITPLKEMERERQRLVAEQQRLRVVLDHIPVALMVLDANGRVALWNTACEKLLPSSTAPPTDIADAVRRWQAFHADGRPVDPRRRPIARALAGESVVGEDLLFVGEDGTETWLWLSGAPMRDAGGTITGAVVVGSNVDHTKRADAALRESQSRLRQLFDSPVIGIIHASLDGAILNANDTFLRTFGYTREDLAAGRLSWLDMTPPEYRAIDEQNVADLRRRRCALVYEKEFLRKDGARVPIALGSTMVEGSSSQCVTFVLDISDRKKSDREREALLESLALSEERYRLAAMASEDQIYDWDIRSDRVSLQAELHNDCCRITTGSNWSELVHPDDRDAAVASLFHAIASGARLWEAEYRLARSDGGWMNVVDRGYIARDASGRPLRVVGAMQDVTCRRQREEFERQLIGIVSHDLKNPLNTILLAVEMMRRSKDLADPQRKNVERIYSAARRATRLVCDLLDFAKARVGGGIQVERSSVDIAPVVEALLDEFRVQQVGGRPIEFQTSGDVRGEFDLDRLGQVLTNLVENALKYSSGEECVRVCLRGEPDAVVLSVHNRGAPISPEQQARIFEPMQRGTQGADAAGGRSVGLGLYIVKHIVEAHGGSVHVSSTEGDGTTFVVRFPR